MNKVCLLVNNFTSFMAKYKSVVDASYRLQGATQNASYAYGATGPAA